MLLFPCGRGEVSHAGRDFWRVSELQDELHHLISPRKRERQVERTLPSTVELTLMA